MAFDIPCPRCTHAVEVFKDEQRARCRRCGHRFANPKGAFDCANWCEYAEQCVGVSASRVNSLIETALAHRLMGAVEGRLRGDTAGFARSLLVFQHAGALMARSGGDARIVLAAALLLPHVSDVVPLEPEEDRAPGGSSPLDPVAVLRSVELDEAAIAQVVELLEVFRRRAVLDTPEFRNLNDARLLAQLATERAAPEASRRDQGHALAADLGTEAGRQRACELFGCGGQVA